jgi:hypothetical protein
MFDIKKCVGDFFAETNNNRKCGVHYFKLGMPIKTEA